MRVLLVEDDEKLGAFIKKGLREAGFAVDHCTDGEEGLIMVTGNEYDAAIVDIMLPNLDGLSLVREVRKKRSILCGTEPVGPIPNIDNIPPDVLPSALANLRKSLDSVLNWSFFITKDMKVDLDQKQLTGTLPVLYVFLARSGCTIDSVTRVSLDDSGNLVDEGKGPTPGVQIVFFGGSTSRQTLYYFASDLANDGIKSNPGFIKFCSRQGEGASLLKAASYLMHEESFSQVREFLLARSNVIVQDDSGIPWHFFDDHKWNIRYCGHYLGPIDIFKTYWQPDLANAYAATVPASLEFGFGYEWQPGRSSLMIATRP